MERSAGSKGSRCMRASVQQLCVGCRLLTGAEGWRVPAAQVLSDEVAELKQAAGTWEQQAQESLGTIERLKDLLEDSAAWDDDQGQPGAQPSGVGMDPASPQAAAAGEAAPEGAGAAAAAEAAARLRAALAREQQRGIALDLQVKALCAELLRAHGAQRELGRSMVPVLGGIEARLLAVSAAVPRPRVR